MTQNASNADVFAESDIRWMQQALELARAGAGLASPNPMVGCVLVKDAVVIGEGLHRYELRDHAEVVALRQAGGAAEGATAYVTLEPCSHKGRTPPCAEALIAAKVKRVVVATLDPNPAVYGQGVSRLRSAGIEVECGLLQSEARAINNAFAKFIQTQVPFVTLKAAISQDGMLAPVVGKQEQKEIFWLTGELAREEVHRLRHGADALLTGIGTVLADDPLLTDRSGMARRRPLLRVVLDSNLQLPLESKLVQSAKDDVLIFCSSKADAHQQAALEQLGVKVQRFENIVPQNDVLNELGKLGVLDLLIEAGTRINSAFLREDLVDEIVFFHAPMVLGSNAVPFADGEIKHHELENRLKQITRKMFGQDECVRGLLHNPWERSGF